MSDDKLIARSNDIGDEGEDAFRWFARRHGMLPTKLERDYGVDFICQVAGERGQTGARPVLGALAGFSVRSTTRPDERITVTRKDA